MDRSAFEKDFARLHNRAYQAAYTILGSRQAAEDIAQEALARAYVRWEKVGSYAEAWLVRVSSNLAISALRRERRRPRLDLERPSGPADAERLDLQRALLALPARQRQVVVLRYLADLPEAETARAIGCSVGSVKRHAHRGLATLRARMATKEG